MAEENPFSAKDKSGTRASETARLRAAEITLWEILDGLIDQGVVDRSDLHNRIDAKCSELSPHGTFNSNEDSEDLSTSLVLKRVKSRLHEKESK